MEPALSKLFVEVNIYGEDISGIVTKIKVKLPNNRYDIMQSAKRVLEDNNNFLFVRFYYMGSYYQIQNKHLRIEE